MSSILDQDILEDFQKESNALIENLDQILTSCEGNLQEMGRLEEYGQTVDRIMGAAKNLALLESNTDHLIHKIGDYTAICKTVGYKASQIENNPHLYEICVAFLQDANEVLGEMFFALERGQSLLKMRDIVSKTFIDRLRWISSELGNQYRTTVDVASKGLSLQGSRGPGTASSSSGSTQNPDPAFAYNPVSEGNAVPASMVNQMQLEELLQRLGLG